MTEQMGHDEQRWARFWCIWWGAKAVSETYCQLSAEVSAEEVRAAAEHWALGLTPRSFGFRCDWEWVDRPPEVWIRSEIYRLEQQLELSRAKINDLRELLCPDSPPPGSWAAKEQGCACSALDNGFGRGSQGNSGWIISDACPVHALAQEEQTESETEGSRGSTA